MNITRSTLLGLLSASLFCLAPPLLHAETNATATVNAPTEDLDALKESADAAMDAKDWAQALKLLDRYLALKPDDAKAHRMRGSVLRELGQSDEAIAAYRKTTELAPQDANGWNGLCWTYTTLNRPMDARAFCEKAVSLDKANYAVLVNYGHTFLLAGDTKTAYRWYRETLLNIDNEDDLKQGPLADFELFIGKGWKVKESRKAKAWFEKEGKSWFARSAPIDKLLADANAADEKEDYALSIALREQRLPLLIALVGENHPRVADARKALTGMRAQRANQLLDEYTVALKKEDYVQSIALLEQCLPLLISTYVGENQSIVVSARKALTDARELRARQLYSLGNFAEALPLYQQVLVERESEEGPYSSEVGIALGNLALSLVTAERNKEAEPLMRRELEIIEKIYGVEHAYTELRLSNLAHLLEKTGRYSEAEPFFRRALTISEKTNGPEHPDVLKRLSDLARILKDLGRYSEAEVFYARAFEIDIKTLGSGHPDFTACLNCYASLLTTTGRYAEAESVMRRALSISEKTLGSIHPTVASILNNQALLRITTGRYTEAEPLLTRALAISEKTQSPEHPSAAVRLGNLAYLYQAMGQYVRAEPFNIRALAISEKANGPEHPDTGQLLNNQASLYQAMGQYPRAEPLYLRALAISEKANGPEHPDTSGRLNNLAGLYESMGQYAKAEPLFLRAWRISSSAGEPELAWSIQGNLMGFYTKSHPDLAIWYGKQAVNTLQAVRANNTSLDKETQKSFLQKNEIAYKSLADLLFGQGRLMEGQQVLAMLKEAEYFDFIQRNSAADSRKTQAGFDGKEKPLADRYNAVSGQLAALSREREALIKKAQLGLTASEQSRKEELDANLADARKAYDAFMVELKREFTQSESAGRAKDERQVAFGEKNLSSLRALQGTLRDLGHGAVTLHYLMTDKRLWILLTTPTVQLKRESAISEAELNKQIGAYREAIARRDPKVKELGKALYDIIIAPVADDLKQADAQTLMLSLDGGLRYLPMAALYDGDKYLAQRYRLAIYTTAATSQLNVPPKANWNLAGFGLTRAVTVGEQSFNALSSVKGELEGIRQDMKGSVKLDQDFTAKTLQSGLESGTSVVHLASHFVFRPGNETDSFLLMGDGSPLSLAAIRDYTFTDVDLLTLSACETAVGGGKDANGREVEGFGVQAQEQGAKAVVASLWPVDDQSTGQFMQLLYGFRQQNPGMTKAEAIQKAQLAFIEGRVGPALAEVSRGGVRRADGSKAATAVTSTDHPYYWAPFILMGNWL